MRGEKPVLGVDGWTPDGWGAGGWDMAGSPKAGCRDSAGTGEVP